MARLIKVHSLFFIRNPCKKPPSSDLRNFKKLEVILRKNLRNLLKLKSWNFKKRKKPWGSKSTVSNTCKGQNLGDLTLPFYQKLWMKILSTVSKLLQNSNTIIAFYWNSLRNFSRNSSFQFNLRNILRNFSFEFALKLRNFWASFSDFLKKPLSFSEILSFL